MSILGSCVACILKHLVTSLTTLLLSISLVARMSSELLLAKMRRTCIREIKQMECYAAQMLRVSYLHPARLSLCSRLNR